MRSFDRLRTFRGKSINQQIIKSINHQIIKSSNQNSLINEFNEIQLKKPFFKIKSALRDHLRQNSNLADLAISYERLTEYNDLIPVSDAGGKPTLWYSVFYEANKLERLQKELIEVYEMLMADGDKMPYVSIASIEFCSFGNSKPFRVKVVNDINDNHDYFYVKKADSSRIYGLELEEVFSPDKVSFLVTGDTLIEEHIVGIPCDEFIEQKKGVKIVNRLRFAKEFVKFNQRCFSRLLGDMRAYNFVVEITQDFDNVQYRLRAIDFDQQCFEGRMRMYLPQYYKDNNELVSLAQEMLSPEIAENYAREERVAMKKRFLANKQRVRSLLRRMRRDKISKPEHIDRLKKDLAKHHNDPTFEQFTGMGDILVLHLEKQLGVKIFG